MRKLMVLEVVGSLLAVAMATSAAGETVYRWTAADGSVVHGPARKPLGKAQL